MQEASLRTLTSQHEPVLRHVKVWHVPVLHHYHVLLASHDPKWRVELMIYWWRACMHNKAPRVLTPTRTVSSPWNLGMNWSPRTISDWLRGRKRQSTLMLHSAGTSAIAQIQGGGGGGGGGRMLLSAERRDAAEAGGELIADRAVKINEGCAVTSSFDVDRTTSTVERSAGFIQTSRERMRLVRAQLDGLSLPQRSRRN